ncbi:protein FAR1-RELATED SEQUENCE 5-like [Rosa rugosa]|uniref:protein FAR1-RELATED SEQUENCE 5-like n=1 Tax=Rosa rugosa TaxID=74645 RepID=UPI002B40B6F6|nr:protein FAR1-RELATED SEQUENCE 5-like [Rosa rugosa]
MEGDELIVRRQWVCSKEGMLRIKPRKEKDVDKDRTPKKQNIGEAKKLRRNMIPRGRRYTRVNYPAAFNIRYCRDRQLYKFLRANRKVEERAVKQVENLHRAQIYTSAAYEHLVEQAGGHEFVGFSAKDLYNILNRKRRKEQVDGDAHAALTWMNMRGMESGKFWCKYSTDEEGRLANLFWRDEQSLLDHSAYGDMLVMDSTYKTNLYGKPLVVFVGCNNHIATVVFGFALIRDEKEDTYTWVFRNFLESMNYKQPVSVLTDGDESVRNVVVLLMLGARHRLCAWHIGRNIGQNVKDDATQKLIGKMIYLSISVGEWEAAWHSMVGRHGLSDNAWVASLYNKRERWAEAFFRGHFFGGMCSTQRVEGMHSKLKKQIGRYTRLCEVMPRMERTLGRIRNRVLYDNFLSKNSAPVYKTQMRGIEEDACRLFTHDIFVMIKSQILFERKFVMEREVAFNISDSMMFYLRQYDRSERKWCVEFRSDPANPKWLCSCKLFESDGIPCGHIFNILKYQLVSRYPKSLISRRWTKAVSETTFAPTLKGRTDDKSAKVAWYSGLISEASKACQNYAFSDEGFKVGMTEFVRLSETSSEFRVDLPTDTSNVPPISNVVRDPTLSRTNGMPSNPSTNTENGTTGQRVCRLCFMPGHNRCTCPGRDEIAPAREEVPSTGSVPHPTDSVNQSTHSVADPASSVPYPARCVPQPDRSFLQPAPLPMLMGMALARCVISQNSHPSLLPSSHPHLVLCIYP